MLLLQLTSIATVVPKSTVVAPVVVEKPVPEIVTVVPPPWGPNAGETEVTVGPVAAEEGVTGINTADIEPNKSVKMAQNQIYVRFIYPSNSLGQSPVETQLTGLYYNENSEFHNFST